MEIEDVGDEFSRLGLIKSISRKSGEDSKRYPISSLRAQIVHSAMQSLKIFTVLTPPDGDYLRSFLTLSRSTLTSLRS